MSLIVSSAQLFLGFPTLRLLRIHFSGVLPWRVILFRLAFVLFIILHAGFVFCFSYTSVKCLLHHTPYTIPLHIVDMLTHKQKLCIHFGTSLQTNLLTSRISWRQDPTQAESPEPSSHSGHEHSAVSTLHVSLLDLQLDRRRCDF